MGKDKYNKVGKASDVTTLNAGEQGLRDSSLAGVSALNNNYANTITSMGSDQMKGLLGNLGTAASQFGTINQGFNGPTMNSLFQNLQGATGGFGAVGQGITGAANAFNNIDVGGYASAANRYDPAAANNALLSQMPNYNSFAQNAAQSALSGTNQSARDLAGMATGDAMRASPAQLASAGLLGSGAGNQSLMEAALRPQQELQTSLAQMNSQYQGNVLGSLMNAGTSMFGQSYETQNQNQLSAAQQEIDRQKLIAQAGLQGATSQLDVQNSNVNAQQGAYQSYQQNLMNQLQGANMGMSANQSVYDSNMNSLMSQLQGYQAQGMNLQNLANATQQNYYTPQYAKQAGALDYVNAGAGLASGIGSLIHG